MPGTPASAEGGTSHGVGDVPRARLRSPSPSLAQAPLRPQAGQRLARPRKLTVLQDVAPSTGHLLGRGADSAVSQKTHPPAWARWGCAGPLGGQEEKEAGERERGQRRESRVSARTSASRASEAGLGDSCGGLLGLTMGCGPAAGAPQLLKQRPPRLHRGGESWARSGPLPPPQLGSTCRRASWSDWLLPQAHTVTSSEVQSAGWVALRAVFGGHRRGLADTATVGSDDNLLAASGVQLLWTQGLDTCLLFSLSVHPVTWASTNAIYFVYFVFLGGGSRA